MPDDGRPRLRPDLGVAAEKMKAMNLEVPKLWERFIRNWEGEEIFNLPNLNLNFLNLKKWR